MIAIILTAEPYTRLWSLPFVAVAIALGIPGIGRLSATLSQPRRKTFSGQVIARWENVGTDDEYCAVDDDERAWTFEGAPVCSVILDDLVEVAVNPRTGRLSRCW